MNGFAIATADPLGLKSTHARGEDLMRVLRDEVIRIITSATVTAFHAVGSSA